MRNKAIHIALGVRHDGKKEVLGLWIEQTEGAKFWLKVFNDLKLRGCEDILIAVTDGLKGMAEAPPRQNSCHLDRILNSGAMMRERVGAIRTRIQRQSGGAVAAAGERNGGVCCA